MARKFLQYQKDCVNQVLKAAMAINAQVLSEMEIPENYIETLPKVRRSLIKLLLQILVCDQFPHCFLWLFARMGGQALGTQSTGV